MEACQRDLVQNIPFFVSRAHEEIAKTVENAKGEVEAYTDMSMTRLAERVLGMHVAAGGAVGELPARAVQLIEQRTTPNPET